VFALLFSHCTNYETFGLIIKNKKANDFYNFFALKNTKLKICTLKENNKSAASPLSYC